MKKIAIPVLSLGLLFAQVTLAGDANTDWSLLRSISSGQLILVKTSAGKNLKGPFQRGTDSTLELKVDGKSVGLQSAEVSRVYILRERQILKGTLIGTAVGTGAGAGIGAIGGKGSHGIIGQGGITAISAGLGLVVGSITGLAIGASRHKKDLVYEAARNR